MFSMLLSLLHADKVYADYHTVMIMLMLLSKLKAMNISTPIHKRIYVFVFPLYMVSNNRQTILWYKYMHCMYNVRLCGQIIYTHMHTYIYPHLRYHRCILAYKKKLQAPERWALQEYGEWGVESVRQTTQTDSFIGEY